MTRLGWSAGSMGRRRAFAGIVRAIALAAALLVTVAPSSARQPATKSAAPVAPTLAAPPAPAAPETPPAAEPAATPAAPPLATLPAAAATDPAPPALLFAAPAITAPLPPQDPRLAQTFTIFETHCAQCHQVGKLSGAAPSGRLANILDLEDLSRAPQFIRRGEPDASRLYHVLLDRHRPLELGADLKWPDPDDIQRVRTWIEELTPDTRTCDARPKITPQSIARAIDAYVQSVGEAAAADLRFVSLAPFANRCAPAQELEAYRQGVSKLLNSLSWGAQPIAPAAIDDAKAVLAFKLSDIGWVDEHWDALTRAEPKSFALDLSGLITAPSVNTRPIRADWLAATAAQGPFYAELLGLPPTLDEMSRLLGITREADLATGKAMRAGIRSSLIARGPRVIERHQADARRLWLAYDFADGAGDHDIFDRPLGGVKGTLEKTQFRADGQRLVFGLPNGFFGFGLFEPDGHRVDQLPARLEGDPARLPGPTVAGLSCLSCHTAGLKTFVDQVRAHVASDKFTGSREAKDQALALYQPGNEWARVLDEDSYRFRRSLIQAGVDPDLSLHGFEPTTALAHLYREGVDLAGAAAESGLTVETLDKKLVEATVADRSLIPRLRQGLLSRREANTVLAALNGKPPPEPAPPAPPGGPVKLALWTDQAVYKPGELMTVYAQPSAPCHLTLISLNASGKATVLFPSEFDPDNLVRPETALAVPDEKAHYQFRLKETGRETIIGQCQTVAKLPAGIEPDYERQRFTVLGNYENFLKASFALTPARPAPAATPVASAPKSSPAKDPRSASLPEQVARGAVSIVIK